MRTQHPIDILLVDDELLVLQSLRNLLEGGGHRITGSCDTVEEAAALLVEATPQLVICDIFFEGEPRGIELCGLLDRRRIPYFLITGQVEQDVVSLARGIHPLGLVYKPLDARDILTRIELRFGTPQAGVPPPTLTVPHRGRNLRLPLGDIYYLEADGNYCYLHLANGTRVPVLRSLYSLLEEFPGPYFLRVHRGYAVNPARVRNYTAGELRLEGGAVLPIGRKYRENFMRWLRQF